MVAGYVRSSHRGQSTVKTKRAPTIRIHAHFGSFGTPLPVLPRQAATRGARDDATECIRGSSSTCDWPATRSDTAACSSSTSACWAPEPVRSSGKASLQHVSRGDSTGHGARPRSRRPQEGLGRNSCDWRITCSLRASSSGPPGPSAAAAFAEREISWKLRTDILRMFWARRSECSLVQNFAPSFVLCGQWLLQSVEY